MVTRHSRYGGPFPSSRSMAPALLFLVLVSLFQSSCVVVAQEQQQDPTKLNGGSCLAMAGRDCVALVLDSRFGSGTNLINVQARHVLLPPPTQENGLFLVALQGLQSDVLALEQELKQAMHNKYARSSIGKVSIREEEGGGEGEFDWNGSDTTDDNGEGPSTFLSSSSSTMTPRALASYTSRLLYSRRQAPYYVEPIIVGLEPYHETVTQQNENGGESQNETPKSIRRYRPYLCSMDLLGSLQEQPLLSSLQKNDNNNNNHPSKDPPTFCCLGTAVPSLYGAAQAFWRPGMEAGELAETCAKAFLAACERDCLSGYGARLYLLRAASDGERPTVEVMDIVTRND